LKANLDEIDLQILRLLQADGRITNAELAKRVGLSPPSALQRVRNLERKDLIRGYHAILNNEKLGLPIAIIAMISLSLHENRAIEQFRKAIDNIPEVVECYHVSGDYDYLLKILVSDIRAYETLIRETISKIRGIRQITSSFVLAVPKHTTQIPL
jgi:Lrp/AsnC family transcriptional regulator, leucine-responsive regulatory protein